MSTTKTTPDEVPRPRLTDTAGAARYLGVSERLVWEMAKASKLPCVRINRCLRFDYAALDRWVEEQQQTAVS